MKKLALEGVRILDLTRFWAGPLAARVLADMGAEVVKVEDLRSRGLASVASLQDSQMTAGLFPNGVPGEQPWNRSGMFNDYHRNKYGVTLDLTTQRGKELFLELVSISDVVIENYTPRVMKNFGLTYPVLKEVNPTLIMISMPGFGSQGPYSNYMALGTIVEPYCGMSSLMGYEKDGPSLMGVNYSDPASAMNAASAITLALFHRRRTGKGQYIDLAHIEAMACLIGHAYVGYSMNKKQPERRGNRHPSWAPHGCYRCKGEDEWVVIAVANDEEWDSFRRAIGNPPWAGEKRFSDHLSRLKNHDELDKLIEEWTIRHDHYEVMHILQQTGVVAAPVVTNKELLEDPHLKAREFYWDVPHPQAGTFPYPRLPQLFSKTPAVLRSSAPCLGEHNEMILSGLLGVAKDELEELEAQGVIGTRPPPE